MALSFEGDLQVDKVLTWKVQLPFENKERQSSHFSMIGSEWCLRFSYKGFLGRVYDDIRKISVDKTIYHVITLNRMIDGQDVPYHGQPLQKQINLKTSLFPSTEDRSKNSFEMHARVNYNKTRIWYAGDTNDEIFKKLPFLYNCSEVIVVCNFYGQPPSALHLDVRTGSGVSFRKRWNPFKSDKAVQVSSEVPPDFQTLSTDFSNLLEEGILPDVKLECADQTVQAHRSVLAARSGVFRAMFQNKMLESRKGFVQIQDMEFAVLQKLLKFLYSGKLEEPSEADIAHLYRAADKYDVASLKKACSYYIVRSLTVENCVSYLQVASSHSDTDLKAAVVSFITKNPCVMKTSDWLLFSEISPLLANEILQSYVSSIVQ